MSETKPRAEQIRFVSDETGAHILDEYIEQAERGGMTIGDLLDVLFDSSGNIQIGLFQFRIQDLGANNYNLQFRVGPYVDPEDGWITISEPVFNQILTAAQGFATTATTQAGIATTQAGNAATSASNAATSETNAGLLVARTSGTSTTSNTVGTGSKSFTTQANKDFAVGRHLLITSNANPDTQRMSGIVTAYNSGTGALTVNVESNIGSATRTDWTIRIDGERGPQGLQGNTGNTGNTGPTGGTTLTLNTQTASYQLVLADAGKLVQMNVASANNLTVPPNSTVAFPVGTQILLHQLGAGQTTVVAAGGVTINRHSYFSLKLRGQYSTAMLIKIATDTWILSGQLELA